MRKTRPLWRGCQRGPSGRLAEAGKSSGQPGAPFLRRESQLESQLAEI